MKSTLSILALLLVIASAAAQQPAADSDTWEVRAKPLTVVETVTARVESTVIAEIRSDMDVWSTLIVQSVLPQGAEVKAEDAVITFETDKIQDKVTEAEHDLRIAELSFQEAQAGLEHFRKVHPLDRALADLSWQHQQEDTRYYFDVQKPLQEKAIAKQLESSQYSVEYAQEELDQLIQMYQEDELTEESEKIVLKRAERSLDQSKFYLQQTEANVKRNLEVEIPRQADQQQRTLDRADLEYRKAQLDFEALELRKRLESEKQTFALDKQRRDHQQLLGDLERMTLRAPAAGTLYHGQSKRGAWVSNIGGGSRIINAGVTIPKDVVVASIVDANSIQLRCELSESQMAAVQAEMTGVARAAVTGGQSLPVRVRSVDPVPIDDGKFDCVIELTEAAAGLRPGMTCEVKLPVYQVESAVLVPKDSVFTDDGGISHFVLVKVGEETTTVPVRLGRTVDKNVEILEGLAAGQRILKTRPE